jgi:hypothetical protein
VHWFDENIKDKRKKAVKRLGMVEQSSVILACWEVEFGRIIV